MYKDIIEIVVSAILGGLVTFYVTLLINKRKERLDKKEKKDQEQKIAFVNRPEMAIVDYKDYISRIGYGIKQKNDIEIYMAHIDNISINNNLYVSYDMNQFDPKDWCCVIYTFENKGKTDISYLDVICTYKKDTVIFPCSRAKEYAATQSLNYSWGYDKKIRVGETVTLKICYHKDKIACSMSSANMEIGMEDSLGVKWCQPLFAPYNKIYDSYRISAKDYKTLIDINDAVECFKNPQMW